MNRNTAQFLPTILIIFLGLFPITSQAKNPAKEAAEKSLTAVTIFMDVNKLTRKNLAAKKMTKHHNEFAAQGYQLVTVSPYTENGDLEGFFLSYQREKP